MPASGQIQPGCSIGRDGSLPSDSFRALLMMSTEELGDDRKKRGWSILSLSISRARVRFVLGLSLMPLAWVYISGL
jgi:hypothetical protein